MSEIVKGVVILVLCLACLCIGFTFLPTQTATVTVNDYWWESSYEVVIWLSTYNPALQRDEFTWVIERRITKTGNEPTASYPALVELRCEGQPIFGCQGTQNWQINYNVNFLYKDKLKLCLVSPEIFANLERGQTYSIKTNMWGTGFACPSLEPITLR